MLESLKKGPSILAVGSVTLLAAILLLWNLGAIQQFTRAEVFYAEIAREMLASGDWLTPHFCDKIFFDKPPISYWLIAFSFQVFGVSETSARLPSALAGILTVVCTTLFAIRYFDARSGFLSGLVLLTSFGFWSFARYAMSDIFFTLFLTIALLSYHEGFRLEKKWQAWLIAGHVSLALAFNTKGPISPILAGLAILLTIILRSHLKWKRLFYPPAIVIFFLVALPWYVSAYLNHGSYFIEYFFYGENFSRFFGSEYFRKAMLDNPGRLSQSATHAPGYYIKVLLALAFPWSLWLPGSLVVYLKERKRDPSNQKTTMYLICWAIAPVVFFSLSRYQLDYYILPSYPAMAILVGSALSRIAGMEGRFVHASRIILILISITLIVLSYLLWRSSIALYPDLSGWFHVALPVVAFLCTALLLGTLKRRYQPAFPYVLASTMFCILLFLSALQYPLSKRYQTVPRLARAIIGEATGKIRVATGFELAGWHPDVRFYTGLPVETLEDLQEVKTFIRKPGLAFLILPESKLKDAFDGSSFYHIVDRGPYLGHRLPGSNFYDRPKKHISVVLVAINFQNR